MLPDTLLQLMSQRVESGHLGFAQLELMLQQLREGAHVSRGLGPGAYSRLQPCCSLYLWSKSKRRAQQGAVRGALHYVDP